MGWLHEDEERMESENHACRIYTNAMCDELTKELSGPSVIGHPLKDWKVRIVEGKSDGKRFYAIFDDAGCPTRHAESLDDLRNAIDFTRFIYGTTTAEINSSRKHGERTDGITITVDVNGNTKEEDE